MGTQKTIVEVARAYNLPDLDGYYCVLADRLWPRGVSKESLPLDCWAKDLAPTTELRKWFAHDVEKWGEFRNRYLAQLADHRSDVEQLIRAADDKPILLIYSTKDEQHNSAVVLRQYIQQLGISG